MTQEQKEIEWCSGNWDSFTFRASSNGYIMVDADGKSNLERYNDALDSLEKSMVRYDQMNKDTETAKKLLLSLDKYQDEIDRLEPIKDEPHLSDGCKTHLADIRTVIRWGGKKDIKLKYFEKGLLLEEDAITLYSLVTGEMFRKNTIHKENEWVQGTYDFTNEDTIIDTKVSWDKFTFGRAASKKINPIYHWQLDTYMWLDNKPHGKLAYCLLNTPEHLIKLEEKKLLYDFVGSEQDYQDACADLRRNHIHTNIPNEERVAIFSVDYNEERIERMKKRVEDCRKYLNQLDARSNILQ